MNVERRPPRVVVTAAWRKEQQAKREATRQRVVHGYGHLYTGLRPERTRARHRAKRRRPVRWRKETRALRRGADAGGAQFGTSARRASHSDTPRPAALPGEGQPEEAMGRSGKQSTILAANH